MTNWAYARRGTRQPVTRTASMRIFTFIVSICTPGPSVLCLRLVAPGILAHKTDLCRPTGCVLYYSNSHGSRRGLRLYRSLRELFQPHSGVRNVAHGVSRG